MEDTDLHGQTPDQAAADPISYVYPIGYSNSSECGYCRQTRSGQSGKRWSYYAIANSLKPAFYQKLVDRFWRRSGSLLYRPNQKNSCCPHYTLRLDSSQFKPTKDQRQAVNRFNRHVLGDNYARDAARLYPRSREEVRRRNNEFDLVERIHEAEAKFCKGGPPPPRAHEFVVTLEPDAFTDEKYAVFENYQRIIHREPPEKITELGFKRFLCNSPLRREKIVGDDGKERQLGSFHQCYRLDGKLVAVGVLDLLPDCVSAVYFLYHESIHSLNPGKLGALREIALAKELGYRWWYSGYYVHNCAKMRYKIDYKPQYVLDPETLAWDLVDEEVLALFDKYPYVCLSRERKKKKKEQDEEGRDQNPDQHGDEDDGKEKSEVGGGSSSSVDSGDESFLLTSDMPGILSLGEMMDVDLSMLQLRSDLTDRLILLSELVIWDTEHISEYGTLKSKIAELVAAIGPDLMGEICIDFRRKQRG